MLSSNKEMRPELGGNDLTHLLPITFKPWLPPRKEREFNTAIASWGGEDILLARLNPDPFQFGYAGFTRQLRVYAQRAESLRHVGDIDLRQLLRQYGLVSIEDPRYGPVSADGKVMVGFSAVRKDGMNFHPYPAFTEIDLNDPADEIRRLTVVTGLGPAKNTLPLNVPNNRILFASRLDSRRFDHTLTIAFADRVTGKIGGIRHEQLPIQSWGSYRYGTTGLPNDITPKTGETRRQLWVTHGVVRNPAPDVEYEYALGLGLRIVAHNGRVRWLTHPTALLSYSTAIELLNNQGIQVKSPDSTKRVVYSTGVKWEKDAMVATVTYLDSKTGRLEANIVDLQDLIWTPGMLAHVA